MRTTLAHTLLVAPSPAVAFDPYKDVKKSGLHISVLHASRLQSTHTFTHTENHRHRHRQTDRSTDRQTDRKERDSQTYRFTDSQTHRLQTHRLTD